MTASFLSLTREERVFCEYITDARDRSDDLEEFVLYAILLHRAHGVRHRRTDPPANQS